MNTAELETLIRTILSEKLAPTPPCLLYTSDAADE